MNAEFFFTSDHAWGSDRIAKLLQTYVDPEITLATWGMDTLDYGAVTTAGNRYAQLLMASLPPEKGLQIEVKSLMWGERRVYVSVYWPVIVSEYGVPNLSYAGAMFFPHNPGLGVFFPALAVHDRMVLVPPGQSETFEQLGPTDAPPASAFSRDVIEVDFRNPDELEAAIRLVGQRLREELWQNFRAYFRLSRGDTSSLLTIAEDLGVSPAVLEETIRTRSTDVASTYEAITSAIEPTRIVQGRWHKLTLRLARGDGAPLGSVVVQVDGPAEIRPSRITIADEVEASVPIAVKSDDVGEFPLEITFVADDEGLPSGSIPARHVWIESVPADSPAV